MVSSFLSNAALVVKEKEKHEARDCMAEDSGPVHEKPH